MDLLRIAECSSRAAWHLQVRVLQAYVNEQGVTPLALNYDFGLVTLASPAPTDTTSLAIAAGEGNDVVLNLVTAGYPADKPSNTMWQVRCAQTVHACRLLPRSPSSLGPLHVQHDHVLLAYAVLMLNSFWTPSAGWVCKRDDGL